MTKLVFLDELERIDATNKNAQVGKVAKEDGSVLELS